VPKPPGAPSLELSELQASAARLQGVDHFEALGVKRDATAAQIKIAYFQLAKWYHPDAMPAGAPPEVSKACADVFARLSEAWGVLGDDARRARYVEELRTGAGTEVDVMAILQAENTFQMATVLVKARKYHEALEKLGEAMQLNPDEPEFAMWKAWCEFLLAPEKKKQHAQASAAIEAGLRKNPRCAQGYLFLGQMAKIVGEVSLAEKHLKRGLSVAPDHAELVRELKYLRR
jgi:curved DNA-binding protein CbpA